MIRLLKFLQTLRDRYLFAFLLTLLLPCVVVSVFVQSTYIQQMDDLILSAAQDRTSRIQQEFDEIFGYINTVTDIVALDAELGTSLTPQQYSKVTDIQTLLKTLRVDQQCVSNIIVFQESSDLLVSARGTYQKDTFCRVYVPDDLSPDAFFDRIQQGGTALINVRSPQGEYWLYSTRFTQKKQNIHLLFLLSKAELQQILSKHLADGTGMLFIHDLSGTVLALQENDPSYAQERYEQILASCRKEIDTVTVGRNRFAVTRSGFSEYGWEVVSIITGDSLSQHAQTQNNIWFLMLFILLLVGVIMVIYLSSAMYKPIHSIKTKVEGLSGGKSNTAARSSIYETISAGIDYLERESLYMRAQIENHHQYLIGKLLSNRVKTQADLDQLCSAFGWDRQRDAFYVCLVRAHPGYSREELVAYFQTVQMRQVRFLVKEMYQEGSFAVIWNTDRQQCDTIDEQLELVRTGDSNIHAITGSSQWSSLEGIPEAFIKAIVTETDQETALPEEACRQLCRLIRDHSWAKAVKAMDALLPQLKAAAQIRYVCLSVALSMPEDASWDPDRFHRDIFELAKRTHIHYYQEYLEAITAFLQESALKHEKPEDQDVPLITKMVRYLANKYNDPTFSIQEMADEFNMSMPGLSKYFHEKQGKLLNEYVTELKMNRAMFLLEHTDMSVAAISQDVGYFNPGSFGRRFRQVMGMSPLEYRRSKLGNNEEDE